MQQARTKRPIGDAGPRSKRTMAEWLSRELPVVDGWLSGVLADAAAEEQAAERHAAGATQLRSRGCINWLQVAQ